MMNNTMQHAMMELLGNRYVRLALLLVPLMLLLSGCGESPSS